jgi:hypothetical protein
MTPHWHLVLASIITAATGVTAVIAVLITSGIDHRKGDQ